MTNPWIPLTDLGRVKPKGGGAEGATNAPYQHHHHARDRRQGTTGRAADFG
ncbi:hypothetical protein CONLIGDRAFT_714608 [Coniochaeta ligniaria NRRL 30616]|uniref:Uncharacterized protein n=1 Tax=Coniochaeta ligniaria NRRL 30616 TaxID=1408157 RepID=A0A1J7IST2_9PEZI|nr:hypothetical protein CONLIGDRAFT_714608 [Coniochaeta ligniaria NRRL 30616]